MRMKLIGISFVICFFVLNVILPKSIASSQGKSKGVPGAPGKRVTSIGVIADSKWGQFHTMLGVSDAMSRELGNKYVRLSPSDEFPVYRLPTINDVGYLAAEANKEMEETIRWLIKRVNELEERVSTLEKKKK